MRGGCDHTRSNESSSLGDNCPACLLAMALGPESSSSPSQWPTAVQGGLPGDSGHLAQSLTPGTLLASRFRITALVGRGGMGEVYRADDLKLGQTIALKFLPPDSPLSGPLERILYDEVRVGRQVAHPNVCRIYDLLDIEGRPAVVMEFVDGEDLASLLERIGRLSYTKALEVARDICSGVDAAHEKGIVHGDLKPGNIMIDGAGRARITDFGLARVAGEGGEKLRAGTVAYMAPEQFQNDASTSRTDLYALGAVLYEIFTGRRVHSDRRGESGTLPARPSIDEPLLDPALDEAILRCLDPDPAARPASVRSLLGLIPGGDALDAAVAAGDTPSPDLVAYSRKVAELAPRPAWLLLISAFAALVLVVVLSDRLTLYGRAELGRSPEALAERARGIAHDLSDVRNSLDQGYRFQADLDQESITFHFRSSATTRLPLTSEGQLQLDDRPATGTAVVLSPSGKLLKLVSNATPSPRSRPAVSWNRILTEAGLNPAATRPTPSDWVPPVAYDQKQVWSADGSTVRAALLDSRLVFFETVPQTTTPDGKLLRNSPLPHVAYLISLLISLGAGGYLARRNMRLRRIDRRAAWRVAAWTFICRALYGLLAAHHPLVIEKESALVATVMGSAIFLAFEVWLAYAALEPYVRRHWPETLVGWARLVQGRFRDSIVGRDLLIGALLGLLARLVDQIRNVVPLVSSLHATPSHLAVDGLTSTHEAVGLIFYCQSRAIFFALFGLFLLVLLRTALRSMAAAGVFWLLATTAMFSRWDDPLIEIPVVAAQMALFLFALHRVGLLAFAATLSVWLVTIYVPLTPDPRAFYFPQSTAAVALVTATVIAGFYTSFGGRSPFAGRLTEALPATV